MNSYLIIPTILGLTVVVQGILNRKISSNWGLPSAVLLNAVVFLVISLVVWLWSRIYPESVPGILQFPEDSMAEVKLWYLIPGLCGFLLVFGMPVSLLVNGPTKTFIFLIASQILFSLAFEKFMTGNYPGTLKITGALLAALGAALVAMS